MKKIILFCLMAVLLLASSYDFVNAASVGMDNFSPTNVYDGRFEDVPSSAWFYKFVKAAYEYGFVSGKSDKSFDPDGNITLAETLVIADQIHSIYFGKEVERYSSNPWFQPYVDYAVQNGIISASDYSDYTKKATRLQFATIMAKALPDEALLPLGNITFIPDVPKDMANASAVYKLYNAGIISGSDEYGTFNPTSNIKRSEVSVIAINMADQTRRAAATLKAPPAVIVKASNSSKNVTYTVGQASLVHDVGDYYDHYIAIVEIKNTGNQPIYMGTCDFEIQDNYEHVLQTETYVSSSHCVIPVGESGYYYDTFTLDKGVTADNGIRVLAKVSLEVSKQNAVRFALSDLTLREGDYGPAVTGKITNNTTANESYLYVRAIYFNKAGDVIDITGTSITSLEAGETRGFEVTGIGLSDLTTMDTIANYKVIAEKTYYQFSW